MSKNRRLVEDFIYRDEGGQQSKTSMPLSSIVLPKEELRYYIDPEEVDKIVASARKNGILEPLLVRPIPDSDRSTTALCTEHHEVVAGAKRYRAAQILGLAEVPVVIRSLNNEEALEIALVENFARSGLTDLESADGVLKLLAMKLQMSVTDVPPLLHRIQNQLRDRLATTNNVIGDETILMVQEVLTNLGNIKLDSFISNRLPLLNLPPDILEVLRQGLLDTSKAKAIARVQDEAMRKELLDVAYADNLSLSQIKQKIKEISLQSKPESPSSSESQSLKQRVNDTFGRFKKAHVWDNPKKKSKVEKLLEQLETLMKEDQ